MASPSVASVGSFSKAAGTGYLTVSMPSGISAGDLLLIFALKTYWWVFQTLDGWTRIGNATVGNGISYEGYYNVYARIAAGSDTAELSSGGNTDSAAICVRVTGHGVSNISTDLKISTAVASSTSSNYNPSSYDAGSSKEWLWFSFLAMQRVGSNTTISGVPTGWTSRGYGGTDTTTTGGAIGVASKAETVQTQDAGAWTNDSAYVGHYYVAVPPVAAASLPARQVRSRIPVLRPSLR